MDVFDQSNTIQKTIHDSQKFDADAQIMQPDSSLAVNASGSDFDVFQQMQKTTGSLHLTTREEFEVHQHSIARENEPEDVKNARLERRRVFNERVVDMMMVDTVSAERLSKAMPDAYKQKLEMEESLKTDAERSGMDKVKHDFFGSKRRAAISKLSAINQRRNDIAKLREQYNKGITAEQQEYVKEETKALPQGRSWYNPLRAISSYVGHGSAKNRQAGGSAFRAVETANGSPIEINTASGILKGQVYSPIIKATGKVVVLFTGTGGSSASMSSSMVTANTAAGAKVICVDYRGFGASYSTDKNGNKTDTDLIENGMYKDARAVYDYVRENMVNNTSDIILQGYSLGGAMASKVAAEICEENAQKLGRGEEVTESDRLGGVILQSPIDNMRMAAGHIAVNSAGKYLSNTLAYGIGAGLGAISYAGIGSYSTQDHMRDVYKFDKNIPVYYSSGEKDHGDYLSLDTTRLHEDKEAAFTNMAVETKSHGHEATVAEFDYDGNYRAPEMIRRLVTYGRGADLTVGNQQESREIHGLAESQAHEVTQVDRLTYYNTHQLSQINGLQNSTLYCNIMCEQLHSELDTYCTKTPALAEKPAVEIVNNLKRTEIFKSYKKQLSECLRGATSWELTGQADANQSIITSVQSNMQQVQNALYLEIQNQPKAGMVLKDIRNEIYEMKGLTETQKKEVLDLVTNHLLSQITSGMIASKSKEKNEQNNDSSNQRNADVLEAMKVFNSAKMMYGSGSADAMKKAFSEQFKENITDEMIRSDISTFSDLLGNSHSNSEDNQHI